METGDSEQPMGISVHAGFPNPATDKLRDGLDLNRLLLGQRGSTFLFRLSGNSGEEYGLFDNDIAVVDRAVTPHKHDLVVWWSRGSEDFIISRYRTVHQDATIWGVVTATIHRFRKNPQ